MVLHIPPSIITIPPEICQLVLKSLSSCDITALRLVSRDYYDYFTSEDLCHFAQKLYFPLSSEAGKPERSRKDFDATYLRSQRWKQGRPSHVEIIDKVAFGSTSLSNGFLVDSDAGLLAYQRTRGVIVLKGLGCIDDDTVGPDIFIDLEAELGECIMKRSESIFLRDGESIRMAMNRGMLLVVGEAHIHPVPHEHQLQGGKGLGILSTLWNWTWGTQAYQTSSGSRNLPPRQFFQHPHTMCAVFSTKPHNRGKLLWTWFERDSFIMETALNEFYAITEFDLVEQRLEGYIFPKTKKAKTTNKRFSLTYKEPVDPLHEGHHFTIKKKALYPALSTFAIAPDTRGKVFYLGFLPPSTDRRPVVEIHALPQFNSVDSTWSECTVVKRVTLRSLGSHARGMNGSILNSSFWIDFDVGTTVKSLRHPKIESSGRFARDPDEDVVRIRMKGDLFIPSITSDTEQVNMVTWDVTARPSPQLPSNIAEWRQGREWAVGPDDPGYISDVSLYKNAQGKTDFEEVYPSPTYNVKIRNREKFLADLEVLPNGVDLDRLEGGNESGLYPPYFWIKDQDKKNKSVHAIYSIMSSDTLILDPENSDEGCGSMSSLPPHDAIAYPHDPGRDDKAFIPAGRLMRPKFKIFLETGRKVEVRDIAKCIDPSPSRRKSKLFGKFREEHHAATAAGAVDVGEGGTKTATTTAAATTVAAAAATSGGLNLVELPFPGFDDARDRVLTRMDKLDKRYWVYGKEAEIRRKGEVLEERVGDKIVIVRFD